MAPAPIGDHALHNTIIPALSHKFHSGTFVCTCGRFGDVWCTPTIVMEWFRAGCIGLALEDPVDNTATVAWPLRHGVPDTSASIYATATLNAFYKGQDRKVLHALLLAVPAEKDKFMLRVGKILQTYRDVGCPN